MNTSRRNTTRDGRGGSAFGPSVKRGEGHGFTLVELLVVIAVIALLIGILLTALSQATKTARRLQCQTQLRSLGQAQVMYVSEWDDALPMNVPFGYEFQGQSGGGRDYPWPAQLFDYVSGNKQIFVCPDYPQKDKVRFDVPDADGDRDASWEHFEQLGVNASSYEMKPDLGPTPFQPSARVAAAQNSAVFDLFFRYMTPQEFGNTIGQTPGGHTLKPVYKMSSVRLPSSTMDKADRFWFHRGGELNVFRQILCLDGSMKQADDVAIMGTDDSEYFREYYFFRSFEGKPDIPE